MFQIEFLPLLNNDFPPSFKYSSFLIVINLSEKKILHISSELFITLITETPCILILKTPGLDIYQEIFNKNSEEKLFDSTSESMKG